VRRGRDSGVVASVVAEMGRRSGRFVPFGNAAITTKANTGILRCAQNDDLKTSDANCDNSGRARAGSDALLESKYSDEVSLLWFCPGSSC